MKSVGSSDSIHIWSSEDENKTPYNPEGYIIMTYSGNHYRLVSYKGITYFKDVKELPNNLVKDVKETCKKNSLFMRIPYFKSKTMFKKK